MTSSLLAWVLCINLVALSPGLRAGFIAKPDEILRDRFGREATILPRNILLTDTQAKEIEELTRQEIKERVFSFYVAEKDKKVLGYAALLVRRIRTKDQAALYFISPEGKVVDIELIAFYEPPEYRPKKDWLDQFKGKSADDPIKLRNEIRVITGATLTARSFVDGARVVLSVWKRHMSGEKK